MSRSKVPPFYNAFGARCPNVINFLYQGVDCDPGYWCGCSDPTGRKCWPGNDLENTAWAGRHTTEDGQVQVGWAPYFPPGFFECDDTLYCPGNDEPYVCPQLCKAGHYCPNATVQLPCPEGHYCLMGSTEPTPCRDLNNCPQGTTIYESGKAFGLVMGLALFCLASLYVVNHFLAEAEAVEDAKDNCKTMSVPTNETRLSRQLPDDVPRPGENKVDANKDGTVEVTVPDKKAAKLAKERRLKRRESTMVVRGPSQTIDIGFQDLQLTLPNGLCIMKGVSGKLEHGNFCAILGPSGAGKTTFLSLIANKVDPTGGKLLVNGKEGSLTEYRRLVGYVPQEDIMLRELTVYENIRHAAMMRLPSTMPKAKKLDRVEKVMESLDLMHIKDSIIGDELRRGISGGQRKRVNVAMELVMDPALICLDEPTSGLDSTSSSMLCESLVALSRLGVNVSAVLHQPKTEIFDMFDNVLLLGVGGKTVYLGPADEMVDYFTRIGFPLPPRTNPADFYMDVVAGLVPCKDNLKFKKEDLFHIWETAPENPDCEKSSEEPTESLTDTQPSSGRTSNTVEDAIREAEEKFKEAEDILRSKFETKKRDFVQLMRHLFSSGNPEVRKIPGFFAQTSLLYRRAVLQRFRVPINTFWPLLLSIFAGAVTGGVGSAMGTSPGDSLQPIYYGVAWPQLEILKASSQFLRNYPIPPANNVVQLWQITGLVILLVSVLGINVFGKERAVFFRDTAGGTLVSAYWLAKTVEVFLWLPLFSGVFASTNYAILSLALPLVDFWIIAWMCFIGFYGIGGCASIMVGLENRGIVTLVTGLLCLLLFTGFLFPFAGKWYFKPFFTFWVAQAFNARMYEYYEDAFDTQHLNEGGARYDLDTTFGFNIGMAFVTAFAWHILTLVLLKVVDFRKQR